VRYVVPWTLLALIACAPLLWIAFRAAAPPDVATARGQLRLAWVLASTAWVWQLWLVAGVAPALRQPLSQLAAFTQGLRALFVRFIPVLVAVLAIMLGAVALVVPGLLLLVLLAPTGAREDAVAVARANFKRLALTIAAVVAGALLIALACQLAIVPTIAKKVAAPKLVPVRTFVRVLALALTLYAPIAAYAIATVTERRAR
jgi:hypothetical protein